MNRLKNLYKNKINSLSSYEVKLIKYLFQCIASEGSKIILFFIFFWKMKLLPEFITALILLMLLRSNGGGIHCKHYLSCFMLSFSILYGSILLASNLQMKPIFLQCTILVCAFAGYQLSPVVSSNRPEASEKLIQKCKRNTLIIILLFFILLCIIPNNLYMHIGFWIIVIHILQLALAKILKEGTIHAIFNMLFKTNRF